MHINDNGTLIRKAHIVTDPNNGQTVIRTEGMPNWVRFALRVPTTSSKLSIVTVHTGQKFRNLLLIIYTNSDNITFID